MKIAIVLSGASGVHLGHRFVEWLPAEIEAHLIATEHARQVERLEGGTLQQYEPDAIGAPVASGSFQVDATAVLPCSMNTLAKIACGIADNLPTRVAAVALKEHKPLLLAPREIPYSAIALENMLKLSRLGVQIAPPVMGYYAEHDSVEAMERFIVGKWYDLLGIEHRLYRRWGRDET